MGNQFIHTNHIASSGIDVLKFWFDFCFPKSNPKSNLTSFDIPVKGHVVGKPVPSAHELSLPKTYPKQDWPSRS